MIQAVGDLGKLDTTLIIYISGDNGASAEGTPFGMPSEVMAFTGVEVPVAEQMKWYDVWGTDQTYPHMAVGWTWAFDTPFKRTNGNTARICSCWERTIAAVLAHWLAWWRR
jgi:arylsulfatase A-like enzyme